MGKEQFINTFYNPDTNEEVNILRCIHKPYEVKECDNCGEDKGCYDDEEFIKRLYNNMCYMEWGKRCSNCNEC